MKGVFGKRVFNKAEMSDLCVVNCTGEKCYFQKENSRMWVKVCLCVHFMNTCM